MQTVRRLIEEGFSKGNLKAVDEVVSPTCIEHQRFDPPLPAGAEGVKTLITNLRRMMPDLNLTVEDTIAAGDKVWLRNKARGTNLGEVMGHPATGKRVVIDIIDVCRIEGGRIEGGRREGGRIVEHWGIADNLALLEQLGIV